MRKTRAVFVLSVLASTGLTSRALGAPSPLAPQGSAVGVANSFFGYSVAIDGDTAIFGALNDDVVDAGPDGPGAAYVYVRSGATWTLQQKLVAGDGVPGDQFGYAVAVSGDTAMVSAAGKANGKGYVYAFTRSRDTWSLRQEFTEASGADNDCFGCAIALSGATAVLGAPGVAGNIGAAYAFVSAGAVWSQQAAFTGLSAGEYFGFSVGLTPAGDVAVVGAFGAANSAGSAYVFTRSAATWTQPQPPLKASDGAPGDRFGYAVAAATGAVLVGAYAAGGPGAAYVFSFNGGVWSQAQKLQAPDPTGSDYFGAAVALSDATALVGAYERSGARGPGAAYVFTRVSGAAGWTQPPQELLAPTPGQYFGASVAAGPSTVVVGAFGASNDSGAAYLFAPGAVPAPAMGRGGAAVALAILLGALGLFVGRTRQGALSS